MPTVYLAGNIEHVPVGEASHWRMWVAERLRQKGIDSYDPFQKTVQSTRFENAEQMWLANFKAVEESEILLANVNMGARPLGTIREIERAFVLKKDVYVVSDELCHDNNPSAWGWSLYPTLEHALYELETTWGTR
jgi:nucleoside 2-deoxyribosyltransferase